MNIEQIVALMERKVFNFPKNYQKVAFFITDCPDKKIQVYIENNTLLTY